MLAAVRVFPECRMPMRVCWLCARTCSGWEDVLTNISPYTFGYMGVALALGLCVIGAAWYAVVALSIMRDRVHLRDDVCVGCYATCLWLEQGHLLDRIHVGSCISEGTPHPVQKPC